MVLEKIDCIHLPCIDTWLRSHKNCPLCRAPIIHEIIGPNLDDVQQNSDDSESTEDMEIDNLETRSGLGSSEVREGGAAEIRVGDGGVGVVVLAVEESRTDEIVRKGLPFMNAGKYDLRVRSDLADNHLACHQIVTFVPSSLNRKQAEYRFQMPSLSTAAFEISGFQMPSLSMAAFEFF